VIPYRTDAPIYHFPWATIALIVLNIITFAAALAAPEDELENWLLIYGEGLHPIQWVTSNFLHGGLMHLTGNMFYLWGFGLIVEGKLGWWKFLLVFFGIGVSECATEQAMMLGALEGGSFGASSIIYGLLAIAMIWAPENEVSIFAFIGIRTFTFDISIKLFAALYIGIEAATVFVSDFAVTSSLLHLMGALLGVAVGTVFVKAGWVDCEGWDLFSRLRGQSARRGQRPAAAAQATTAVRPGITWTAAKISAAIERMRSQLQASQTRAALAIYEQIAPHASAAQWTENDLTSLIKSLHDAQLWNESVPVMVHFLGVFPQNDARVRLKLAQVLTRELNRPSQALRVLGRIRAGELPQQLEKVRRNLEQQATKHRDEGEIELETEDW